MRYRFPYVGTDLRYLALSQTPAFTARPRIWASVSRDGPVYSPSFRWVLIAPTHGGMAQAEKSLVPGSAPRRFTRPTTVTHPGTNRAWGGVTTLLETKVLPLSQTGNQ